MKQKLLFVFLLFSYCLVAQNRQSPDQFSFDIPDSVGKNAVELAKIIRSGYPDDDGFVSRITSYNVCYTKLLRVWKLTSRALLPP